MGKSLDFVKKETGLKKGFEFNADMVFDNYSSKCKIEENLWCFEFMRPDTNEKFEIKVKYDPEADFLTSFIRSFISTPPFDINISKETHKVNIYYCILTPGVIY
mgnify:CR=1 FL=1